MAEAPGASGAASHSEHVEYNEKVARQFVIAATFGALRRSLSAALRQAGHGHALLVHDPA